MINVSQIMKNAHREAKRSALAVINYREAFAIALRNAWAAAKNTVTNESVIEYLLTQTEFAFKMQPVVENNMVYTSVRASEGVWVRLSNNTVTFKKSNKVAGWVANAIAKKFNLTVL